MNEIFAEFARCMKMGVSPDSADALFIAEPAAWLGALLCTFLPYFYYRKKYLDGKTP